MLDRAEAERLVKAAYVGLLRREPDEPAFNHYVNELAAGSLEPAQLLSYFTGLNEFYRQAEPEDRRYAIAALYAGGPLAELGDPFRWVDEQTNLVLFHIPKTAGISLRRMLASYYHPLQLGSDGGIDRLPSRGRHQKFFCWHMTWGEYVEIPTPKVTVTCLRDPTDRLRSFFRFLRSIRATADPPYKPAAEAASKGLRAFLQSDNPDVRNMVDNIYVRTFAGAYATASDDPLHNDPQGCLSLAIERVSRFQGVFFLDELKGPNGELPDRIVSIFSEAVGRRVASNIQKLNATVDPCPLPLSEDAHLRARTALDLEFYSHLRDLVSRGAI